MVFSSKPTPYCKSTCPDNLMSTLSVCFGRRVKEASTLIRKPLTRETGGDRTATICPSSISSSFLQELLEQGAHYLFITSKDNLVWLALWHPPTQKEAWSWCSAMWDEPDCRPPPTIHHPSPSCHEKALSSRWSLPWQAGGTGSQLLIIRRFRSYLMIVYGDWQGVGWSVSGCIRSWQQVNLQSPCSSLSLKSPRKPLFPIPGLGHVSYLILTV